jgi:two-component system, NtrC family, nitrogen regulation sensor histidine kinase NtrY
MGLNSYRLGLIIRIIALLVVMLLFSILVTQLKWFFTSLIMGVVLTITIVDLIRYIFRFRKDIENLIDSYEESNFQLKPRVTKQRSKLKEVDKAFDRIQRVVQKSRIEREVQFNFLRILIENIPSGVITINQDNKIVNINQAAKSILNLSDTIHWNTIKKLYPHFAGQIESNSTSSNELISLSENEELNQISYSIITIKLEQEIIKIVSFQNIKSVLDKNEMQAWNNLIRTMTHEIMNSVTPIISLAESGLNILQAKRDEENPLLLTEKNFDHLDKSFNSIYNKSLWLRGFVDDYRKLIRIPQPILKEVNLTDVINSCVQNLSEIFLKEKIDIKITSEDLFAKIDQNLIDQVVTNILKNSIDALEKTVDKRIEISILKIDGDPNILIIDNGEGIKPENSKEIFIPFYTTKNSGSGIGLNLSRQIMKKHGGDIMFESEPGIKTVFKIVFRQVNHHQ